MKRLGLAMPMDRSSRTRILSDRSRSGTAIVRSTDIRRIREFVGGLSAFPLSRTLVNPYRSRRRRQNLEAYLAALLAWPYSGHLLVGEAPGERGCARTGIPFTDERLLRSDSHPFLQSLRHAVRVSGSVAESTAGIVWRHLSDCRAVPAFWNAVPFHPRSDRESNRAPTPGELASCQAFLSQILRLLSPHSVVAVGRTAERALGRLGIRNFGAVRHPSHGGKRAFIQGLRSAGIVGTAAADSPQDYGGGALGGALGEAGGPETRTWISSPTTRTG
jgi:uracil-DNA glycosylase